MGLWHLSPSVNSIFKHACAAIHWGYKSWFLVRQSSTSIRYVCEQDGSGMTAHSLFAYAISSIISLIVAISYCKDPYFSDRQVKANSVEQTVPNQGLHCHSIHIFWMHYSLIKPHSLNFRIIIPPQTMFVGVYCFHDVRPYVRLSFRVSVRPWCFGFEKAMMEIHQILQTHWYR